MSGWVPGIRYSYALWTRGECRTEARERRRERARIAGMSDTELTAYLGRQAAHAGISWLARVSYRAGWHEIAIVRGAAGVPRI